MWFCYIIKSDTGKTYVGKTNDLLRRLREHNGEIKGGAKYTTSNGNKWEFIGYITGFKNESNCLSCEWRIKHPTGKKKNAKKFYGDVGRIKGLNIVLNLDKWSSKCNIKNSECEYILFLKDEYKQHIEKLPNNVKLRSVSEESKFIMSKIMIF
jgi:predicted GIY-YIG superfamily endonuclease